MTRSEIQTALTDRVSLYDRLFPDDDPPSASDSEELIDVVQKLRREVKLVYDAFNAAEKALDREGDQGLGANKSPGERIPGGQMDPDTSALRFVVLILALSNDNLKQQLRAKHAEH